MALLLLFFFAAVVVDVDLVAVLALLVDPGEDCAEDRADAVSQESSECPQGIDGQGAEAAEQGDGEAIEPEGRELARHHEVGAVEEDQKTAEGAEVPVDRIHLIVSPFG